GKNVIDRNLVNKNSILIGVGIRKDKDGLLKGDYDESEIKDAVSAFTPTPGGVGPVNVAFLLKNVLKAV
ncbi:MAG: Bifunctional protein FolD, partial [Candidatus Levybacteria bacterium GW2011_GWA2_36_13]